MQMRRAWEVGNQAGQRAAGLASSEESARLEPYYRLVELQKEIIEIVRQNAETERQCALLRERLAREAEVLLQARRSRLFRKRVAIVEFLQRLFHRASPRSQSPPRGPDGLSRPAGPPWDCLLSSAQATQDQG
jgi:hypothetical protein